MRAPRARHTATLLENVQVLVTGGEDADGNVLNVSERYWVDDNIWGYTTDFMSTARRHHTATRLADGRVLAAGGSDGTHSQLASAEIYSPSTTRWTDTGAMAAARQLHSATLLNDGRVLVAGGVSSSHPWYLTSAEIYDPATRTWSSAGNMNYGRYGHTATRLADGRVMVMGGIGADALPLNKGEIYNPATNGWMVVPRSPYDARSEHTATLLDDGRVVVAGGMGGAFPPYARVTIYDPLSCVTNSSFERGSLDPGDGFIRLTEGSTVMAQWTVEAGNIDYRGDWAASEGELCVDLNGSMAGIITQILNTRRGAGYLLTFDMAGHPGGTQGIKNLRVYAGSQYQHFTFNTLGKDVGNMGWTAKSWFFTAESILTTLKFRSLTAGSYGPAIDRVRVVRLDRMPPVLPLLLD